MMDNTKYKVGYFGPPGDNTAWVKRDRIEKAPVWCSVDMRDGNQSLINPMSLEEKLSYFQTLLEVGFK
ncbi:MAG: 2-isopropylmalate synthase, partial [Clostridia bacterium]|nr:2-isopropylmalate synthase [Clostridia bacterium]